MSLQTSALLMTLRLGSFAPKRKDKRVTADVLRQHHVSDKDLGAWSTTLLPAHATDPIGAIASRVRKFHTTQTLCWDREGTGLLPGSKYLPYMTEMNDLRSEWDEKVRHFCQHYPDYLDEARRTLNSLFNPDLYPKPERVREKFSFRLDAEPIPTAGDFRIQMRDIDRHALAAQLEDRLAEATKAAQQDLLSRVAEPLTRLVNNLAKPDGIVRQPQLAALERVLSDLEAYNVTSDPRITSLKAELQSALRWNADQLTHDATLRDAAAEKARAVLDKMSAWA